MGADFSLYERFLGHLYYFETHEICPTTLGWAFARPRMFCRMRHKEKARDLIFDQWTSHISIHYNYFIAVAVNYSLTYIYIYTGIYKYITNNIIYTNKPTI